MNKFARAIVCAVLAAATLTSAAVSFAEEAKATTAPTAAEENTADASVTAEPLLTDEPAETADMPDKPEVSEEPSSTGEPLSTEEPSASAAHIYTSNSVSFNINITYRRYVVDSFIKMGIYNKNGELLDTKREWVGGVTRKVALHFNLPKYTLGETFVVKLESGAESVSYYDKKIASGETFEIKTGVSYDGNGNAVAANIFNFDAVPLWEREVNVYVGDKRLDLKPRARLVGGNAMVPVRQIANAMGLDMHYDKRYDSVVCSVGSQEAIFNLGSTYATFFNKTTYLPAAAQYIQNCAYVPLRPLADAFKAPIEVKYGEQSMDIILGDSETVLNYNPVNEWNISSSTDYMVWVSKHEYKVRLYQGSKNKWKLIRTAPCAIGAPGTPTITGSYEYIERTQWDYGTYYVGPVLRFHNGYALHSTLLYYGGGEYDGRVGVQISHGCIRLHPEDINYLANTIPLKTRIYITE